MKKDIIWNVGEYHMKQNKFYSYNIHQLCDGCKYCIKGKKTVIYITGLCPRRCYYCPLSDAKRWKDVMFANERPVKSLNEMVEEIKISSSDGVGITGGDPLVVLERTISLIKILKKKFGKSFHIHLYTSLDLVDIKKLEKLYLAGLDEIRFHPDLDDDKLWDRLCLAKKFGWKVGVEIPAIPGYYKKIMNLIKVVADNISFLNINELEVSDTNGNKLRDMGFVCKNRQSYAVKGSQEMAFRLVQNISKIHPKLRIHYCTSKLKDAVQLSNRLKLRAKSISKEYDIVTDEGMLVRGFICSSDKKYILSLKNKYEIPSFLIEFDKKRNQILIASWVLQELYKEIPYKCGLVTEYPSFDRMIVEVDWLNE
jgi:uncharacterized protein